MVCGVDWRMIFCHKCGAIMIPKKDRKGVTRLVCGGCGYKSNKRESIVLREKIEVGRDKIEVVDKRVETLPKTKEECPKCKNKEAFYWSVQTRAADEAETRFFKCTKCNHTWRLY